MQKIYPYVPEGKILPATPPYRGVDGPGRRVKGTLIIRVYEAVEELLGEKARKILEAETGLPLEQIDPQAFYPTETYVKLRTALDLLLGKASRVVLLRVGYLASKSLNTSRFGTPIARLLKGLSGIGDWRRFIGYAVKKVVAERVPIGDVDYALEPDGSLTVRIHNSLESSYTSNAEEPVCHITRGFLKYMTEAFTGKKVAVQEVKCRAKGDPYCEFHITPLG